MASFRINDDLELRTLALAHSDELFDLVNRNREHLRRWLPWVDDTRSRFDIEEFIYGTLRQKDARNGFQAGIWYQERLIGVIGFHAIDWINRKTSIGYWLGKGFQGKGLMGASCSALVQHAFDDLRLNRVEIRCAVRNRRSRAIPKRLGFKQEGVIRETEWLYDHFVDHVVYGMTARDWQRKQTSIMKRLFGLDRPS